MISISIQVIKYFNKNEENIEKFLDFKYYSLNSKNGYEACQFTDENNIVRYFKRSDFVFWQRNKHIYNSPLYEALSEE